MISQTIFRQYDIRGVVHQEFTPQDSYMITKGIIAYAYEQGIALQSLVVGRDGRVHSDEIFEQVKLACIDAGIDVIDVGVVTSPMLYFALFHTEHHHGVMITASHNPAEYNGFKISFHKKSLYGAAITRIGQIIKEEAFPPFPAEAEGSVETLDIHTPYVNFLVNEFKDLKDLDTSIIFDCNHSPATSVMTPLVEKLNLKNASLIHTILDGTFAIQKPDPTVDKYGQILKSHIKNAQTPTIGIAFDGDADRVACRTEEGNLIAGDTLLALLSKDLLQTYPGASIVFDIKGSSSLVKTITNNHGVACMAATGHSNIKVEMEKRHALLAGELSGHYFYADTYFGFDDGVYAAFRLLRLLTKSAHSLTELVNQIPATVCTPEIRIPCPEHTKAALFENLLAHFSAASDAQLITIDGIRVEKSYGWGLIRPSNTEPMISLRFEASTQDDLNKIQQDFVDALRATQIDAEVVKQHLFIQTSI